MSKLGKIFGSLFGGKKKKPLPLPPLPKREDPEIEIARKNAAVAARVRGGRSKTILTSGFGLPDDDEEEQIKRSEARRAKLLGS